MGWNEIVIEVPQQQAELLSTALMDAGALSVSVEDADAGTESEKPLFGEPGMDLKAAWEHSRVIALVDPDMEPADLLAQASLAAGLPQAPTYVLRQVEEQDWVRLT